ncbi:hypothetical protein ACIRPT_27550 [Streptomyces sp. NPDC101227]|uniref:hypothetical protein n=1 Tax=Streptomyces sp. NPDC101227 TaxID=3366136 RepID=UPI00381250A4
MPGARGPGAKINLSGTFCTFCTYHWNAATHADEAEGEPERRAFTRPEREAFFGHADEEVLRVRDKARKGWLPAFRDATLFKVAYAYGLRRNETRMSSRDGAPLATNVQGFRLSVIRSASALNSTVMPCSASASMIATMSTGGPSRCGSNTPR